MYGKLANPPLFSLLLGAPLPPLSPPRWAAAAAAAAAAGRAAKRGRGEGERQMELGEGEVEARGPHGKSFLG